ncbi:hypothetical protein [Haliangium ochraceum]|uniref:Proteinase inhibitor I1 Kazal n=1 Tax=Haliangium ochraceum (strain DSM 14365 / JCM 11303 / SMP-2) TaxID=502025 RepID=D0LG09_HALO1|nr:hypothetical protein [Haliangium ochraceum]ACY14611.1 proteinase inhibitor I1 Kazal [Haliangium ochraceum DSM 14365]
MHTHQSGLDPRLPHPVRDRAGRRVGGLLLVALFALLVGVSGCGDDSDSSSIDAAPADGPVADAPPADADNDTDAGPTVCGGLEGVKCADGFYCDYPNNDCGANDVTGMCERVPTDCTPEIEGPLCGCDGESYADDCDAAKAGTDVNPDSFCTA